jgi:tRNA nucleotidyltransferase (CCA-adding enzyme)
MLFGGSGSASQNTWVDSKGPEHLIQRQQQGQAGANAHWEHYAHGADIGIRGIGPNIEEAFEQAAVALTCVITDASRVQHCKEVMIRCQAPDREVLLVDWLNALVYEMAVRRMILGRFHVSIEGNQLCGRAWGEETDVARHEPAVEVKGATFTDLFVGQTSGGDWVAQCVVDV